MMKIGAQMYTVREYCKTLDSFADTLAKLADMGFKVVQISGTCPYTGEWIDEQLKKNGLECAITHNPYNEIMNDTAALIEKHKKFGCNFIGLGGIGRKEKTINDFIADVKPAVKAIKEAGLHFSYHNHSEEFFKVDGTNELEKMMAAFAPDELSFTFDTHWAHAAGADPIQWLKKLKGRVQCIHLKDIELYFGENGREIRYGVVGKGNMNFEGILAAADESDVQYGLIEQDDCYGADPFECMKRSYEFLTTRYGLK